MKRLLVLVLLVAACGGEPKGTEARVEKCDDAPGLSWQYDHTERWTTSEAVYGTQTYIDFQTGELKTKYGIVGYETIQHSREVFDCLHRR